MIPSQCVCWEIADLFWLTAEEGSIGGKDVNRTDDDAELELDLLDDAFQHYKMRYDDKHGGFGGAPKFPTPVHIRPLLRVASYPATVREIVGEEECIEARRMALMTLEKMAKGGIKDQIGHGFARYSVSDAFVVKSWVSVAVLIDDVARS